MSWLTQVYKELYTSNEIGHLPMAYEQFKRLTVFGKTMLSRGNHSPVVSAYWSCIEGSLSSRELRFGKIQHYFRHSITRGSTVVQQEYTGSNITLVMIPLILTLLFSIQNILIVIHSFLCMLVEYLIDVHLLPIRSSLIWICQCMYSSKVLE